MGYRAVFIGQSMEREPSDQTDLRNGVDAIQRGGGGIFQKMANRWAHGGSSGMVVGPIGLTWHPLVLHFSVVSSGVL
jgi:hypothetical protein